MPPSISFDHLENRRLFAGLVNIVRQFSGAMQTDNSGLAGIVVNLFTESSDGALKGTFSTPDATNLPLTGQLQADRTFTLDLAIHDAARATFNGKVDNNGALVGAYKHFKNNSLDEIGTFGFLPHPGAARNMRGQYEGSHVFSVEPDPFLIRIDSQRGATFAGKIFQSFGPALPITGYVQTNTNQVVIAWHNSPSFETQLIGTLDPDGSMPAGQFFPSGIDLGTSQPAKFFQTISDVPAAGAIDGNFGTVGKTDVGFQSNDIAVQDDGKIVVAGSSNGQFDIGRFNRDGTVDPDFATGGQFLGGTHATANGVAIQDDGKIVMVGTQGDLSQNDLLEQMIVVRLNSDGTPDSSFGDNGTVPLDFTHDTQGYALTLQEDGKIVVAGNELGDFALTRLNFDGTTDTGFGDNGQVLTTFEFAGGGSGARGLAIQDDGKIVGVGSDADPNALDGSSNFALARYNTDGTLDDTFGTAGEVLSDVSLADELQRVLITPAGKIQAVGFTGDVGNANLALLRYNADGTLDSTFNNSGVVTTDFGGDDHATALVLQADGLIMTSGISRRDTAAQSFVARYQADGALDTTFGNDGRFFPGASGSAPQSVSAPGDLQDSFANFFKSAKAIIAQQKKGRILLLVTTEEGSTITQIVADGLPPTAKATAVKLTVTKKNYTFAVTFSDNIALNPATLKSGNVLVTGPRKFRQKAKLVSVKTVGQTVSATYAVTGPAGQWDGIDNGTYTLTIQKNQVADSAGNFTKTAKLKNFTVNIGRKVAPDVAGRGSLRADTGSRPIFATTEIELSSAPLLPSDRDDQRATPTLTV